MESYIVRIYRREESTGNIVGMVEEIGVKGQRAFKDGHELLEILSGKKGRYHTRKNENKDIRKLNFNERRNP